MMLPLQFNEFLVDVMRLPINNLIFISPEPHLTRLEKSKDAIKLVKVFEETGFHPSILGHQIVGIIDRVALENISNSARLSRNDSDERL